MTGRRGRCTQLLDDLKEKTLKTEKEAIDRTVTLEEVVDLTFRAVYVVTQRLLWRMAERQLIGSREPCGMML